MLATVKTKTSMDENLLVRVPTGTKEKLKLKAKAKGITMSELIRQALKKTIK